MAPRERDVLVTRYLDRAFPHLTWMPSPDRGSHLHVSNPAGTRSVSLCIRTSRNYSSIYLSREAQPGIPAVGWWTIPRQRLLSSPADYWVFVLADSDTGRNEFALVSPAELSQRMDAIHPGADPLQMYLFITSRRSCWEGRNLGKADQQMIADGVFAEPKRDFTAYLDNWRPLERLASL